MTCKNHYMTLKMALTAHNALRDHVPFRALYTTLPVKVRHLMGKWGHYRRKVKLSLIIIIFGQVWRAGLKNPTAHKGLFRYNRLVFGIASAPAIWQRTMEQILQGIPGVQCLLDDMIITGKTDAEHLANLEEVLERLQRYGLKANSCKYQDKVVFCGHEIDKQGLHKTQEKIDAVLQTPYPKTVTQLRAFLGLVNYYARFLPDLASLLHPLHQLLEKGRSWDWSKECNQAFGGVKLVMSIQGPCPTSCHCIIHSS